MRIKQVNNEVIFVETSTVKIDRQIIDCLKQNAHKTQRKRFRLCAHKNIADNIHEMFIAKTIGTYVRPHKNLNKNKSFHIIEGMVDLVMFDNEGNIIKVIEMGDYFSNRIFYYRMFDPGYHTILINSDILVFKETINGPFNKSDTVYALWAPEENDRNAVKKYFEYLLQSVKKIKKK